MLRDQDGSMASDRPLTAAWRALTLGGLLSATFAVATFRGPARAADDDTPAASPRAAAPATETRIEPPYVRDGMDGLVAIRPAAIHRRIGTGRAAALLSGALGVDLVNLPKQLKVDTTRPGFRKLGWEEIEWLACAFGVGRAKHPRGDDLHSLTLGSLTVRTVAPFDWPAFLRQWRLDLVEARVGDRAYFKIEGPLKPGLGPDPCVYVLDDRTVVFDREKEIRALAAREVPPLPDYLRGPDWERAGRGLLAVAVDNRDGAFAKRYDLGRPDDAMALSIFKGVEHWTFGVADADSIALHAVGSCLGANAGEAIAGAIHSLLRTARDAIEPPDAEAPAAGADQRMYRMAVALLTNLSVRRVDRKVEVRGEGFGTLADFASIVEAGEAKPREPGEKERPEGRQK
jgi:hypothetical protein